ncbi:MAG: isoprenyl transferase [Anaerolineaceae bacterium]|nr:isoprenyl transferase [Anaerolineaceae bacterium]
MAPRKETIIFDKLPTHIAIIMDGNGRWAKNKHLPRMAGHRAGTENLRNIIKACVEFKIKYLTVYAFSTENWKRSQDEINGLMQILADVLEKEMEELHRQGVCLRHIGRLEKLDPILQKKINSAIELTKDNNRLILNIAWNYGGRDEIIYAVQRIIMEGIKADEINEEIFGKFLFTHQSPDPDLVIRTSGEMRTSNYLIWQSAYSEWYFTPTLWPDFGRDQLKEAIIDFGNRDRRFGGRNRKDLNQPYAH